MSNSSSFNRYDRLKKVIYIHDLLDIFNNPTKFQLDQIRT